MYISAIEAFLLAFAVTFAAEMGDRSQFITIILSVRYNWRTILCGLSIASFIVLGIAAIAGDLLLGIIPKKYIDIISTALMLFFSLYTLYESNKLPEKASASIGKNAYLTIIMTFFLAEFGDKTMITTAGLAAQYPTYIIWLGSSLGLIFSNAITLFLGKKILSRISTAQLRKIGAICFGGITEWQIYTLGLPLIMRVTISIASLLLFITLWIYLKTTYKKPIKSTHSTIITITPEYSRSD